MIIDNDSKKNFKIEDGTGSTGWFKKMLHVQLSATLLFYGAGDLKFCTDILQNYTI